MEVDGIMDDGEESMGGMRRSNSSNFWVMDCIDSLRDTW